MKKNLNPYNKIMSLDELTSHLKIIRNRKLVFTNGCFDLLHLGHIDYLNKAARLGDFLIVGLNTDQSVRGLKGPGRPINNEESRSKLLSALECVDCVVLFDEDTPLNLIKKILPDVLVKGADYTIDKIIGHEIVLANNGSVETITFLEGYSSSRIINKIKNGQN
jgi:rfaE bifunctional protein nucleotidyltransferase chain/domain